MIKSIVHIGYPRTGTTWFQNNYFPFAENYALIPRKLIQDSLIHPSSLSFNSKNLTSRFENGKNIIISEEMILGRIRAGSANHLFLKENISRLKECLPNAKYVIFLRNQADLALSLYKLYLQKGGTYNLKRFLAPKNKIEELNLFSPDYLNFFNPLNFLRENVGKDNLYVFLYEDFCDNPHNFMVKFNSGFDIELNINSIDFKRINRGVSVKKFNRTRLKHRFTKYGIPFKHYIVHIPGIYGKPDSNYIQNEPSVIPEKIKKLLYEFSLQYGESNRLVMNEFDLPEMKEYGYSIR